MVISKKEERALAAVLGALFLVLSLALGSLFMAAAGAVAPTTCVAMEGRFINSPGSPAKTAEVVVDLQPGQYEVEITTSDAYEGRSASDSSKQQGERVFVLGITTADLEDGTESASLVTRGVVTLPNGASSILIEHVPAGGWDSVAVPAVCFTQLDLGPEPEPVTTTTIPVEPEPTTTLPPTTEPEPEPTTTVVEPEPTTTAPPVTEPPVEVTVPEPVPEPAPPVEPCASYPDNFVPSYDVNGNEILGLCQLPPGSCVEGESVLVPGKLTCQYLPVNESG